MQRSHGQHRQAAWKELLGEQLSLWQSLYSQDSYLRFEVNVVVQGVSLLQCLDVVNFLYVCLKRSC